MEHLLYTRRYTIFIPDPDVFVYNVANSYIYHKPNGECHRINFIIQKLRDDIKSYLPEISDSILL